MAGGPRLFCPQHGVPHISILRCGFADVQIIVEMVGARGFEPPTPCSRSRCATRLRYAPTLGTEDLRLRCLTALRGQLRPAGNCIGPRYRSGWRSIAPLRLPTDSVYQKFAGRIRPGVFPRSYAARMVGSVPATYFAAGGAGLAAAFLTAFFAPGFFGTP